MLPAESPSLVSLSGLFILGYLGVATSYSKWRFLLQGLCLAASLLGTTWSVFCESDVADMIKYLEAGRLSWIVLVGPI